MNETVERIKQKDPVLAQGIHQAAHSLRTDPAMSLSKCRRLLEQLLNKIDEIEGCNLDSKIKALTNRVPRLVSTHMHFVRKLGNIGSHADEDVDTSSAAQGLNSLIAIACWHYGITSENKVSGSTMPEESVKKSV